MADDAGRSVASTTQGGERLQGVLVASCMVLWQGKGTPGKAHGPQNLENSPHT